MISYDTDYECGEAKSRGEADAIKDGARVGGGGGMERGGMNARVHGGVEGARGQSYPR